MSINGATITQSVPHNVTQINAAKNIMTSQHGNAFFLFVHAHFELTLVLKTIKRKNLNFMS